MKSGVKVLSQTICEGGKAHEDNCIHEISIFNYIKLKASISDKKEAKHLTKMIR